LCRRSGSSSELLSIGTVSFSTGTTHKLAISRTSAGIIKAYWDQVEISSSSDSTYSDFPYIGVYIQSGYGSDINRHYFDDVKRYPLSGTYTSEIKSVGTFTSWGTFQANTSGSGGSVAYAIYADTDTSFTPSNTVTFTSSETITSGVTPTLTSGSYVAIVATLNRSDSGDNAVLNDFELIWYGATSSRHFGAVDKTHRLIWSVEDDGTDVSYIFDQRFGSWLKYSFPFHAPIVVGQNIYFGSSSTGKVYKFPIGNDDDGSAITAFWKSKDFVGDDPFLESTYNSFSFISKSESGSNLDLTYTINTTDETNINFSLTDPNSVYYRRINDYFPSGTYGSFINFNIGNNDTNAPFELYGFTIDSTQRPWRVME